MKKLEKHDRNNRNKKTKIGIRTEPFLTKSK